MAAFGILAALRERDRSGEGQLVDVSMADGALSWLAMVAARYFADGVVAAPRRARARRRAGLLPAVRVRRRLGHARRAGAEVLAGVVPRRRPRGPDRAAVRARPARDAHARSRRSSSSARASEWAAFASEHDCCLEPVLELDEALDSELVRAREMVVELDQPGARAAGAPARRAGQARAARRATPTARPGPALGEHTDEVLAARRLRRRGDRARCWRRAPSAGPAAGRARGRSCSVNDADGLLKMSELAERSGVSAGHDQALPARGAARRAATRSCARRATWPTTRPSSSSGSG